MSLKPVKTGAAPSSVSKYTIESIPGGAVITYEVPEGSFRFRTAYLPLNAIDTFYSAPVKIAY